VKKIHFIDSNIDVDQCESSKTATDSRECPPSEHSNQSEDLSDMPIIGDDDEDDDDAAADNDDENDDDDEDDDAAVAATAAADDDDNDDDDDVMLDKLANYTFHTTVRTPLNRNPTDPNDGSMKPYADIHLSINIFLPKMNLSGQVR
jgi:hypothetical protein